MKINTDPLNMDAWVSMVIYMWDPEYCDSQLRASGESREELCPSTPENTAENQPQADAWYTCDQCLAVAQRHHRQICFWVYP